MFTAVKVVPDREFAYEVDEEAYEVDTRARLNEPYFFQKTSGRKREAFTFYRGCIITSYTASGTGWKARHHVPYIVCHKEGISLCMSTGDYNNKSKEAAKRCIDRALDSGIMRV